MKQLYRYAQRTGLLLLAAVAGFAMAQQDSLSVDEAVIITGLQGDAFEILSSELALERSGSDSIQQFAQLMIDDHSTSSSRLQELAGAMGTEAEFVAAPGHGLMLARLRQLEGDQFDVEYLSQQRMAHKAALVNYSIAAELAEDEELARFASETAAVITEHLQLLQDLMANLGISDAYDSFLDTPLGAPPAGEVQQETPEEEQPEEQQPQQDEQPEEEQPAEEESVDQDAQDELGADGEQDDQ